MQNFGGKDKFNRKIHRLHPVPLRYFHWHGAMRKEDQCGTFLETKIDSLLRVFLVGGFNPSEKYESKWVHLPRIGLKIKNV